MHTPNEQCCPCKQAHLGHPAHDPCPQETPRARPTGPLKRGRACPDAPPARLRHPLARRDRARPLARPQPQATVQAPPAAPADGGLWGMQRRARLRASTRPQVARPQAHARGWGSPQGTRLPRARGWGCPQGRPPHARGWLALKHHRGDILLLRLGVQVLASAPKLSLIHI